MVRNKRIKRPEKGKASVIRAGTLHVDAGPVSDNIHLQKEWNRQLELGYKKRKALPDAYHDAFKSKGAQLVIAEKMLPSEPVARYTTLYRLRAVVLHLSIEKYKKARMKGDVKTMRKLEAMALGFRERIDPELEELEKKAFKSYTNYSNSRVLEQLTPEERLKLKKYLEKEITKALREKQKKKRRSDETS